MSAPHAIAIFRALSGGVTPQRWLLAFLPVVVWGALVWTLGGLDPVPEGLEVSNRFDELAHLVMYGTLGLLCGRAWRTIDGRGVAAVVIIVLALALGAADEWRQAGIGGRTASPTDWIADGAGVLVGFFLAASFGRQRQRT